jgi:hypothetical protein
MIVSIQKACELSGRSRSTLNRYISSGKLSKRDGGVDTSELIRVFGALKGSGDTPKVTPDTESVTHRERWLMDQIDALQKQLNELKVESLEREKRLLSLLEHRIGVSEVADTQPKKSWLDRFR